MKILSIDDYKTGKKVFEYRTPGAKNKKKIGDNTEVINPDEPVRPGETVATVGDDVVKVDNYDDFAGMPAEENPSEGVFDIDAPVPEDAESFKDKKTWNKNLKNLWLAIKTGSNFFVQGEAGWAKTAIITQMAKKAGYTVITVYLDKAVPEDLSGLPALKDDPNRPGRVVEARALPLWAQYMLDHSSTKFLLFFDEMNQASNEVMNALMPICLKKTICNIKFNNFFVGAAGNMSFENPGLEAIPRPLMARLGGKPITWITGTVEAWRDAFSYLHKVWDSKISKKVVDAFETNCTIFASPRDLELYVFQKLYNYKNAFADDDEEYERIDLETITDLVRDQTNTVEGVQYSNKEGNEYTAGIQKIVDKLANVCYAFLNRSASSTATERSFDSEDDKNEGEAGNYSNDEINKIITLITQGEYYIDENNKQTAPVTHETIYDFVPGMTKELLKFIDKQMKKEGKTWVYPTNEDAIASGKWSRSDLYD